MFYSSCIGQLIVKRWRQRLDRMPLSELCNATADITGQHAVHKLVLAKGLRPVGA